VNNLLDNVFIEKSESDAAVGQSR